MSLHDSPLRILNHSPQQRAELLDRTQWARDFDFQQVKLLAGYLESAQLPGGAVLFEEGAAETSMLIVVQGEVDILKTDASGRARVVVTLGTGKTIGELALLDGQPRSATARASGDVVLLRMTPKNFQRMQDEVPKLAIKVVIKIARLMSGHLRQTTSRLSDSIGDGAPPKG
jgi:CRP/FNR family cyclic AMP-dependent transcriptional regulator